MDYKEKIQILRACSSKKGNRCSSCPAFGQGNRNCMRNAMKDAATAIAMLQNENKQLHVLAELANKRSNDYRTMRDRAVKAEAENEQLRIELNRIKSSEVLEAVDELMEFARIRMSTADWLYYVEILGEWCRQKEG